MPSLYNAWPASLRDPTAPPPDAEDSATALRSFITGIENGILSPDHTTRIAYLTRICGDSCAGFVVMPAWLDLTFGAAYSYQTNII